MPNQAWQTIHSRGEQTLAVWNAHSPAFKVGEMTFALHQADVQGLPPLGQAAEDAQDVVDDARAARAAAPCHQSTKC
jgi:hypothetical protein